MQPTMNLRFVRRETGYPKRVVLILQQQWEEKDGLIGRIGKRPTEWRDVPVAHTGEMV